MARDSLSVTFAALADPTRRAILARLISSEVTVGKLAEPFNMTPPAVTKHLRVLERAGLIVRGRDAQRRPCRLRATPLKAAAVWIAEYQQVWEERLERLDDYLSGLQKKGTQNVRRKKSPE
jgi:DNA-binding transcriptional ArsR family regulator